MTRSFFVLTVLMVVFSEWASGSESFSAGVQAFQKEQWDQAQTEFEKSLQDSSTRFSALYNLGNIAVRRGQLGLAYSYYLNAQAERPRDADLRHNLTQVQTKLRRPEGRLPFMSQFYLEFLTKVKNAEVWVVLIIASIVLALGLLKFRKSRKSASGDEPYVQLAISAAISFVAVTLLILKSPLFAPQLGVVVESKIELKSGPNATNAVLTDLTEGSIVSVVSQLPDWYQVISPSGTVGWVNQSSLRTIEQEALF